MSKTYVLELTPAEASHLFDWLDAALAKDEFTDEENTLAAERIRDKLATFWS